MEVSEEGVVHTRLPRQLTLLQAPNTHQTLRRLQVEVEAAPTHQLARVTIRISIHRHRLSILHLHHRMLHQSRQPLPRREVTRGSVESMFNFLEHGRQ